MLSNIAKVYQKILLPSPKLFFCHWGFNKSTIHPVALTPPAEHHLLFNRSPVPLPNLYVPRSRRTVSSFSSSSASSSLPLIAWLWCTIFICIDPNHSFFFSPRISHFLMSPLKFSSKISRQSIAFKGCLIWNEMIAHVLNTCKVYPKNITVPGSSPHIILSAFIAVIKNRFKKHLFQIQALQTPGRINKLVTHIIRS